jgi:hypothetical protein
MAEEIGALAIRIGADASQLVSELGRAEKSVKDLKDGYEGAVRSAKTFATIAVAVGAALATATVKAADNAEKLHDLAQGAGVATQEFSELAYAAGLSGVSTEQLATSISRLNRGISEASQGGGEAAKAFNALGISVRGADGNLKNADQIMSEVADKFATFADGPEKSALAIAMFGRAGAAMIPMLNSGSAAIRALRQEAIDLGLTIDGETGKAAGEFNDKLAALGKVGVGAANNLMRELLPALTTITEQLVKASRESGGFKDEMSTLADLLQGGVLNVFQALAVLGSDVGFVFKMIGGEIGVIAAQIAKYLEATATLGKERTKKFAEARLIGDEWAKDAAQARKDLDDFQARIMNLGKIKVVPPSEQGGAMDMGGSGDIFKPRKKAPGMAEDSTKAMREAQRVAEQILEGEEEFRKNSDEAWKFYYDSLKSKVKDVTHEIITSQEELSHVTPGDGVDLIKDDQGNVVGGVRQVERDSVEGRRLLEEERLKIIMDAYDREQELAIQRGQEILEAEKMGHTMKLDWLRENVFAGEEQLEIEAHERKLERLAEFSEAELEALGGYQAIKEQWEREHQDRLNDIRNKAGNKALAFMKALRDGDLRNAADNLQQMTAGLASHNKKMFEINKLAGMASVTMKGIESVTSAYAWAANWGGPPAGAAAAAIAGAFAIAQLNAIRSQQFGGGASAGGAAAAPSLAGTTPAQPVSPVGGDRRGPDTFIQLVGGDMLSTEQVRGLLQRISDATRDGGRVVLR